MDEENGGISFILGFAMGIGSGLLVGVALFLALVYFAPGFPGIRHSDKSAWMAPGVAAPGGPAKASPFQR